MIQRTRNTLRWLAASTLTSLGIPASHSRKRRRKGRWGIILRYHRVIPPEEPASFYRIGLDARLFEAQMKWLNDTHKVVSLDEFLIVRDSGKTPPHDLVVLTFDDGYRDNWTRAVPVLQELGLPATFYVSSACLTERMPFWPETLARIFRTTSVRQVTIPGAGEKTTMPLDSEAQRRDACRAVTASLRVHPMAWIKRVIDSIATELKVDIDVANNATPPVLSADDLRSMIEAGFTIGAHAVNHPYLSSESDEDQRREIEDSRRQLEEAIGKPVVDFCYPGGGYNSTTRELVEKAGYRSATTTDHGVAGPADDPFLLPRIGVGEALALGPGRRFSAAMMHAELSGCLSAFRSSRR